MRHYPAVCGLGILKESTTTLPAKRSCMLKSLIFVLMAVTPFSAAFGASPLAAPSIPSHQAAVSSTHKFHRVTAAQRRAHARWLAHERWLKAHRASAHTAGRRKLAHRVVSRRVVSRRVAAHRVVARGTAAHRAYEARLARERRLRAHRAYEARLAHQHWLAHEHWLRTHPAEARLERRREAAHLAYEHRLAVERAARERAEMAKANSAPPAAAEIAKVTAPGSVTGPVTGTVHPASMDYISHANLHLYWTSPLRGTHASLVRQDARNRAEGLTRIKTEAQLRELVQEHALIPLPLNADIQADPRLAYDRRYTRPWTAEFLRDLGWAFTNRFGEPLVITSAVRPASYQAHLTWRNGNAAPANGVIASPHEFGATIDIGKKGMTAREIAWMRGYLLPLQQAGQIDVEEEFYQACFHITVYKAYVPAPLSQPQPEMAATQTEAGAR